MDTKFICVGKQPKVRHEVSAILCSLFQADLQDTSSSIYKYIYIYFWSRNKPKYRYPYSQTEIEMRTLTPTHTRQQKTIYEASSIFSLCIAVGPKGNARPRLTTSGYVRVFRHAPTLKHGTASAPGQHCTSWAHDPSVWVDAAQRNNFW